MRCTGYWMESHGALQIFKFSSMTTTSSMNDVARSQQQPSKESFNCQRCGKHYGNKGNLVRHVKFECGVAPMFKCPFCQTRWKRKDNMEAHIRSMHLREVK